MGFYTVIKKNEISMKKNEMSLLTDKWMEPENIILNKVIQVQKDKVHVFTHMWKIDPIQIHALLYII
jgi:hypothetical protein